MSGIKNIGFIGMGNMGVPMAANLVRAGYDVTAYDIAAGRARNSPKRQCARRGIARGPRSELRSGHHHAAERPRGAPRPAGGGRPRAHPEFACRQHRHRHELADPVGTRRLGAELPARNIELVDARCRAACPRQDGTLAIMIGGSAGAVQAVEPVLSKMGGKLFEVGGLGCGHAMKALNNLLAGTSFAAASEAVRVGRTFGLDPAVMIDVINVSTGRSFPTDLVMKQHVLSGTFATGFALGLLAKDVGIAADLASQVGADAPIGRMISDLWEQARDAIGPEQDHSRAAEYWERK